MNPTAILLSIAVGASLLPMASAASAEGLHWATPMAKDQTTPAGEVDVSDDASELAKPPRDANAIALPRGKTHPKPPRPGRRLADRFRR
jgi:hypothetical protein